MRFSLQKFTEVLTSSEITFNNYGRRVMLILVHTAYLVAKLASLVPPLSQSQTCNLRSNLEELKIQLLITLKGGSLLS